MSRNPLLIIHKATILSSNNNIRTNSLRYLFGILLCFITGVANAQQCQNTVTGYIIDLHDQTPLVNATIIVALALLLALQINLHMHVLKTVSHH